MTEFIINSDQLERLIEAIEHDTGREINRVVIDGTRAAEIVRCRDCKHLDDSEYKRWDSALAENYGEPPLFCDLLSVNEWRMDGDRRVVETSFAEVEPDGFCSWGERKEVRE